MIKLAMTMVAYAAMLAAAVAVVVDDAACAATTVGTASIAAYATIVIACLIIPGTPPL